MAGFPINLFSEVERELSNIVGKVSLDPQLIDRKVLELESRLSIDVYSQLLYLLCHLDFSAEEAKFHWNHILEHRNKLSNKVGQPIDFRVALLDYFISVNQHFENPKIIEIKIFQKTQDCAIRDELTGLFNYRYFYAELDLELRRAERGAKPLSLAIFDIDYFKWYNDQNGHLAGDKALMAVAKVLQEEVRDSDLVARYGGEEFAILFPDTSKPKAFKVADRIRRKISEYPFPFGSNQPNGRLTISGGIATFRADAAISLELIEAADSALYCAKGSGKNRVLTAGDENRGYPRVLAHVAGKLQCLSQEEQPFLTDNLSEQGLQFHCQTELQEGEYFRFTLSISDDGQKIDGVARVVRVNKGSPDDIYEVGAQIVEISYQNSRILREYLEKRISLAGDAVIANDSR